MLFPSVAPAASAQQVRSSLPVLLPTTRHAEAASRRGAQRTLRRAGPAAVLCNASQARGQLVRCTSACRHATPRDLRGVRRRRHADQSVARMDAIAKCMDSRHTPHRSPRPNSLSRAAACLGAADGGIHQPSSAQSADRRQCMNYERPVSNTTGLDPCNLPHSCLGCILLRCCVGREAAERSSTRSGPTRCAASRTWRPPAQTVPRREPAPQRLVLWPLQKRAGAAPPVVRTVLWTVCSMCRVKQRPEAAPYAQSRAKSSN
eukprot:7377188-Prymnesium_polylepis.5